jgi:galactokinase
VVSENQRVLDAVKALRQSDLVLFGQLMNASHDSLRDDYEVTGTELDTLVEEARKVEGVLGSRMTGAGFGGCTVSLVHKDAIDRFITEVGSAYHAKTGLKPDFYLGEVGDGARKI